LLNLLRIVEALAGPWVRPLAVTREMLRGGDFSMTTRKRAGALSVDEKKLVKALLAEGMRNQDIQALVNTGRDATVNSARITGVKKDDTIKPATGDEVTFYKKKQQSYDWQTGLNLYDDERLIRAREAMILAVQVFNNPACCFKTEFFSVLANIAWTYLLHTYYEQQGVKIINRSGHSLLLSQMLKRTDCPLSKGAKANLATMIGIRDAVEHLLLRRSDLKWAPLFQACCLNFEAFIVKLYGEKLSLQRELSFALQFTKLDIDQINTFQNFDIPKKDRGVRCSIAKRSNRGGTRGPRISISSGLHT
jgi:Protein of unknown function (DUF3644)